MVSLVMLAEKTCVSYHHKACVVANEELDLVMSDTWLRERAVHFATRLIEGVKAFDCWTDGFK
jgi:hypothetical protein